MERVNVVYIDGVPIVVPNQQPRTTKFLIEMDRELGRDPFAMDKFAKAPVSNQDIWDSATVVPL
jgi:hypothetical protein